MTRNRLFVITALLTTALLLCAFFSVEAKYYFIGLNADNSETSVSLERFYYNYLSYRQQRLYDALLTAISEKADQTEILPYRYSQAELDETMRGFKADYPEYFYFDSSGVELEKSWNRSRVSLTYFDSAEMTDGMADALSMAISSSAGDINGYDSEFALETELHDYLLRSCEYAAEDEYNGLYGTAYGALVLGKATSEGYSMAFKLLLNSCGISSCVVYGSADGSPHVWNMVYIDGSYFNVDASWDDADLEFAPDLRFHGYYNLSDAQFMLNHTPNDPGILPSAENDEDYYLKRGLYVSDEASLKRILSEQITAAGNDGLDYIELYLDLPLSEKQINALIVEAIKSVNGSGGYGFKEVCRMFSAAYQSGATTVQLFYESE